MRINLRILSILVCFSSLLFNGVDSPANAQLNHGGYSTTPSPQKASMTFANNSAYSMTIRVLYAGGGYYSTVSLRPYSSSVLTFSQTNRFKIKIKAVSSNGHVSYHDGGNFSVKCTPSEWSEGKMSFQLSSYGNGLGPSISSKEFESNY